MRLSSTNHTADRRWASQAANQVHLVSAGIGYRLFMRAPSAPKTLGQYANEVQGTLGGEINKALVNEITVGNRPEVSGAEQILGNEEGNRPNYCKMCWIQFPRTNKHRGTENAEKSRIELHLFSEHPEIQTLEQARKFFGGATSESRFARPPEDPFIGQWATSLR